MMTNLLDNAVQHTPAGSSVNVVVTGEGTVTITVVDTGPGIPHADRERVFDRFVRLDLARSAESGGGLGLPIARWVAEQHHGTLALDPSQRGCVFVVRLPLPSPATTNQGPAEHRDRRSAEKMNAT